MYIYSTPDTRNNLEDIISDLVLLQEDQDWGIVAMVLDRMFLWVFGAAAVVGSTMILTESPSLFDSIQPIDSQITTIGMDTPPPLQT